MMSETKVLIDKYRTKILNNSPCNYCRCNNTIFHSDCKRMTRNDRHPKYQSDTKNTKITWIYERQHITTKMWIQIPTTTAYKLYFKSKTWSSCFNRCWWKSCKAVSSIGVLDSDVDSNLFLFWHRSPMSNIFLLLFVSSHESALSLDAVWENKNR